MDELKPSTVEDFERHARAQATKTAETVKLPSGLIVKIYRPGPEWWIRNGGMLPKSVLKRMHGEEADMDTVAPEDIIDMAKFTRMVISEVVLDPKVSDIPGPDVVHPRLIDDEDLNFILRYAGGDVAADGRSIETFRRKSGSTAAVASS